MSFPIYISASANLTTIGGRVGIGISGAVNAFANTPATLLAQSQARIYQQMNSAFGVINNTVGRTTQQINALANGVVATQNLFNRIQNGTINSSNQHLFQQPSTVLSFAQADPTALDGAFVDIANVYSYLGVQSDVINGQGQFDDSDDGDDNFGANSGGDQVGLSIISEMRYRSAAAELASSPFIPKQKFLYVMQIMFNPGFQLTGINVPDISRSLTFLTKSWNRPTMEIIYEDVNLYNFRTKVPKTVKYEPVTINFIDDDSNVAMGLLSMIMRSISPIFNWNRSASPEDSGMKHDVHPIEYKGLRVNEHGAQLGPLQNATLWTSIDVAASTRGVSQDVTTPIKYVKMFHVYNAGRNVNVYTFNNPRVLTFQMDQLTMSDCGDGCQVSMQFAYDWMHIEDGAAAFAYSTEIEASIRGAGMKVNPFTQGQYQPEPEDTSPIDSEFESTGQELVDPDNPLGLRVRRALVPPTFNPVPVDVPASTAEQLGDGIPSDEVQRISTFSAPPIYT